MLPVMLLAAGKGLRLYPLTAHRPKPLIAAGGKPLIFWHLEALAAAGAARVVINVCPDEDGGRQLERAVADGRRWGLEVVWSRQKKRRDTGGDVAAALPLLGDGPFALINPDIHTDYPRERLLEPGSAPDGNRALARMVLAPPPPAERGDCNLCDGRVVLAQGRPDWTFTGMSVLHPGLFEGAPGSSFRLWHDLLLPAAERKKVLGELYDGLWQDAGTHQRLMHLRNRLQRAMADGSGYHIHRRQER